MHLSDLIRRRKFAERNPGIAEYDAPAMLEDGLSKQLHSVAADFAAKQVSEMQAGMWRSSSNSARPRSFADHDLLLS